jgi:hypothetical protein
VFRAPDGEPRELTQLWIDRQGSSDAEASQFDVPGAIESWHADHTYEDADGAPVRERTLSGRFNDDYLFIVRAYGYADAFADLELAAITESMRVTLGT